MKTKTIEEITEYLANEVFRDYYKWFDFDRDDCAVELLDIIASLHNLLYEKETGKRYNYMFHWANKAGGWCQDNIFDLDYKNNEEVD